MVEYDPQNYTRYTFGDTEFIVPSRYIELSARGTGAQGMVWWVNFHWCISTNKSNSVWSLEWTNNWLEG